MSKARHLFKSIRIRDTVNQDSSNRCGSYFPNRSKAPWHPLLWWESCHDRVIIASCEDPPHGVDPKCGRSRDKYIGHNNFFGVKFDAYPGVSRNVLKVSHQTIRNINH